MISELVNKLDESKVVAIKSKECRVELSFDALDTMIGFWVYEYDTSIGEVICSAHYDSGGSLTSKHIFKYECRNGRICMVKYVILDQQNSLASMTEYVNDNLGRCIITRFFGQKGDLEYFSEKQWDGYECISTIYRDKKGNQIQPPEEYTLI